MKTTYATPTISSSADVVSATQSGKTELVTENDANSKKPVGGTNLSFGL